MNTLKLGGSTDNLSEISPKRLALTPAESQTLIEDDPLPAPAIAPPGQQEAPASSQPRQLDVPATADSSEAKREQEPLAEPQQVRSPALLPKPAEALPPPPQVRSPGFVPKQDVPPTQPPQVRSPAIPMKEAPAPNQDPPPHPPQVPKADGQGAGGPVAASKAQVQANTTETDPPAHPRQPSMYEDGSYWKC